MIKEENSKEFSRYSSDIQLMFETSFLTSNNIREKRDGENNLTTPDDEEMSKHAIKVEKEEPKH